jgi:hypothetical protein
MNNHEAGWVKLVGNPKPMDVAKVAKSLFEAIASDNPLDDRESAMAKAKRFYATMHELEGGQRIESWHPNYWAFAESRDVFGAACDPRATT